MNQRYRNLRFCSHKMQHLHTRSKNDEQHQSFASPRGSLTLPILSTILWPRQTSRSLWSTRWRSLHCPGSSAPLSESGTNIAIDSPASSTAFESPLSTEKFNVMCGFFRHTQVCAPRGNGHYFFLYRQLDMVANAHSSRTLSRTVPLW